jgi:hypothetical protein
MEVADFCYRDSASMQIETRSGVGGGFVVLARLAKIIEFRRASALEEFLAFVGVELARNSLLR